MPLLFLYLSIILLYSFSLSLHSRWNSLTKGQRLRYFSVSSYNFCSCASTYFYSYSFLSFRRSSLVIVGVSPGNISLDFKLKVPCLLGIGEGMSFSLGANVDISPPLSDPPVLWLRFSEGD